MGHDISDLRKLWTSKTRGNHMEQYDVVVVGAGNAGLSAAIQMALAGKKTLLIEQHNLPGGCATSFRRGRFEIEPSLHELCDLGPEENPGDMRHLFDAYGIQVQWNRVPDCFRIITTASDGSPMDVTMPSGVDAFIDAMERYVPGSREKMRDLFDLFQEILDGIAYITASGGHADPEVLKEKYPNLLRTGAYPTKKVFEALELPQRCQDILATYWTYLGVDLEHLAFVHYAAMVHKYVSRGAYIPTYTSHEISVAMTERLRELGGKIWFNCRAEEILFDGDDHVCGLRTTAGVVETRHIVCNANPTMVYANMVPEHIVPDRERKLAGARRYSARMFVVYMGLNKSAEELGLKDYSYFLPQSADSVKEYESLKRIETNKYNIALCYNVVNPKASPEGTCIVSLTTTYMEDCWGEIDPKDYVKKKNEVASDMIDWFEEKTGIIIRPYIEEFEVATPWTFCHYASVPEGAAYGYELRDWDNMMPRMAMMRAEYPVKGLKFCGASSIRGDGFNSAIFSGDTIAKLTISEINAEEAK